jgi:hypothetical protein
MRACWGKKQGYERDQRLPMLCPVEANVNRNLITNYSNRAHLDQIAQHISAVTILPLAAL